MGWLKEGRPLRDGGTLLILCDGWNWGEARDRYKMSREIMNKRERSYKTLALGSLKDNSFRSAASIEPPRTALRQFWRPTWGGLKGISSKTTTARA